MLIPDFCMKIDEIKSIIILFTRYLIIHVHCPIVVKHSVFEIDLRPYKEGAIAA